jgi:hypothetical protein
VSEPAHPAVAARPSHAPMCSSKNIGFVWMHERSMPILMGYATRFIAAGEEVGARESSGGEAGTWLDERSMADPL